MSLELFSRALKGCAAYTDLIALHLLGDPLTIPNLSDYLDLLWESNLRAEITTSGFYLGNHEQKILRHKAIKQINISLTSYDSNAKKCDFDTYMKNIFSLINQKNRYNIPEYINLRLWNLGTNRFEEAILAKLSEHFKVTIEPRITRTRLQHKVILDLATLFEWRAKEPKNRGYCLALKSHMAILSDGEIVPCCFDAMGALSLGNIKNISLKNALDSPRACEIKGGFERGEIVEEFCKKCGYIKRFVKE